MFECMPGEDGTRVGGKLVEEVGFSTSETATSLRFRGVVQVTVVESSVVRRVVTLLCSESVRPCVDTGTGSRRRKTKGKFLSL